jgi:hypothetical protein
MVTDCTPSPTEVNRVPALRAPSEPALGSRVGVILLTALSRTTTTTSCGSL